MAYRLIAKVDSDNRYFPELNKRMGIISSVSGINNTYVLYAATDLPDLNVGVFNSYRIYINAALKNSFHFK